MLDEESAYQWAKLDGLLRGKGADHPNHSTERSLQKDKTMKAVWVIESHGYDAICQNSSWRHQMETFSALLAICARNSPVTGEFPAQRPVTRSFDVFFDLRVE